MAKHTEVTSNAAEEDQSPGQSYWRIVIRIERDMEEGVRDRMLRLGNASR